jgi:hypothetical protein
VRACYVPVRLAATVMVVAAAAGCMSVGDDAGSPPASPSVGRHGDDGPDGGSATSGGAETGLGGAAAKAGQRRPGQPGAGLSASPSASASGGGGGTKGVEPTAKEPSNHGKGSGRAVPPAPTVGEPAPTGTTGDPSPTTRPDPPSPTPTTAEPSSSAPGQAAQLVEREPAPRAGDPAA